MGPGWRDVPKMAGGTCQAHGTVDPSCGDDGTGIDESRDDTGDNEGGPGTDGTEEGRPGLIAEEDIPRSITGESPAGDRDWRTASPEHNGEGPSGCTVVSASVAEVAAGAGGISEEELSCMSASVSEVAAGMGASVAEVAACAGAAANSDSPSTLVCRSRN